jgi:PKD repeat protein
VGTGLQPTWIDFTGGDTIWSVAVTATAVYTGGHNRWQNNPYASAMAGPGAVPRPGLAALDPATGVPFDWNPTRTTGVGVFDLLATDQGLWIGDDTEVVGHEFHFRLAFFPLAGGESVPHPATGSLPNQVYQLGQLATPALTVGACGATTTPGAADVVLHRTFDGAVAGLPIPLLSEGTAWGQARGAFMLSGVLYTAWADGTFCRSTFDGSTFGAPQPVNLAPAGNVNKFAADIPKITGMFFSGNRIYYTMTRSTTLSYRYFSPQDDIVGALAYPAGGNVQGIDFSTVDGMFLSGNRLYFVTPNGAVHRIDWSGTGPVGGTAVALSGPGVNNDLSWASQALFVYAPAGAVASNQRPQANFTPSCGDLTCSFSNDGTWDPDGSIASYAWDFGDGASSSATSPTHAYANPGTYQVTLTATDNDGAVATASKQVIVTRAPKPPIASFSVACTHLNCVVNGTASSDPDGTIRSYAWDFGDGTPLDTSSATTSHTYTADGNYTIKLTVTDNDGLTGSATHPVGVAGTAPGISFIGESDRNANGTSWSVQVPASVVAGDGFVLSASANSATADLTPSGTGWSLLGSKVASSITTRVWQKVAGPDDAGSTVTFTSPALIKADVVLLAYHGTDPTTPVGAVAGAAATKSSTAHTTPTVKAPADGAWVVSLWADKSSATTTLTPPGGQTQRYFGCSTGTGRICSLLTDSGPISGGSTAGGLTAVADAASPADTMWTLVLTAAT